MQVKKFSMLPDDTRTILTEASSRLHHSLNKVSNPRTSAIAMTKHAKYYGNNIFLSNCTLFCAEAMALAAAVAANDKNIHTLYLASGRGDTKSPKLISPCGNCRQILHDFSLLNKNDIRVFITTSEQKETLITSASELTPEGFRSASLGKMAEQS